MPCTLNASVCSITQCTLSDDVLEFTLYPTLQCIAMQCNAWWLKSDTITTHNYNQSSIELNVCQKQCIAKVRFLFRSEIVAKVFLAMFHIKHTTICVPTSSFVTEWLSRTNGHTQAIMYARTDGHTQAQTDGWRYARTDKQMNACTGPRTHASSSLTLIYWGQYEL